MQALPTPLTTAQLDGLLVTIETLPSATVNRDAHTVTVNARRKTNGATVRVLDAVQFADQLWRVSAVEGLINVK